MQFGFMSGNGTTDATFAVRQIQEQFLLQVRNWLFGFVDIEQAIGYPRR